jgi:stearoyl-CoA desaturase (delta-9 desaturase)
MEAASTAAATPTLLVDGAGAAAAEGEPVTHGPEAIGAAAESAPAPAPLVTELNDFVPAIVRRGWTRCVTMVRYGWVGVPVRTALAVVGLWRCISVGVGGRTALLALALWPFTGLGVTAGAHRLWSHGTFTPTTTMELLLLLMFAMADQGPVMSWALTHKAHHRHSDTPLDPHNRTRGFWHSHIGWVLDPSTSAGVTREDALRVVTRSSAAVKAHDRHCVWLDPLCNLGVPTAIAACWGDALGGLLVAGALRWIVVQHVTFLVNSMAHGEVRFWLALPRLASP